MIAAFQYLKESYRKEGDRLFSRACGDITRRKGFQIKEGRFRLDIRKKFFTVRLVRHWKRLPRALSSLALEVSRVKTSTLSLGNLFQCLTTLCKRFFPYI